MLAFQSEHRDQKRQEIEYAGSKPGGICSMLMYGTVANGVPDDAAAQFPISGRSGLIYEKRDLVSGHFSVLLSGPI